MKPSRKTVKVWAAIIFALTLFINGIMAVFMFWLGKVPQSWMAGMFMLVCTGAAIATFTTYLVMINPDWWKNLEDLESDRIEYRRKLAEIRELRQKYISRFENG